MALGSVDPDIGARVGAATRCRLVRRGRWRSSRRSRSRGPAPPRPRAASPRLKRSNARSRNVLVESDPLVADVKPHAARWSAELRARSARAVADRVLDEVRQRLLDPQAIARIDRPALGRHGRGSGWRSAREPRSGWPPFREVPSRRSLPSSAPGRPRRSGRPRAGRPRAARVGPPLRCRTRLLLCSAASSSA